MTNGKYSKQLSYGANNRVIALSETEVAKIFEGDSRSDIGSEAEKMRFANGINHLVCQFGRLDFDDANNWDMLVMERIHPLDFRAIDVGISAMKEKVGDKLFSKYIEVELKELAEFKQYFLSR